LAGANNVSIVFKDGDRHDANVVDRSAFKDSAMLKIVDNNNTRAPGIVRFSGDSDSI
jgi:S1-C subfamily serine protease